MRTAKNLPDSGGSVDLHVHTFFSDGTFSPADVVARASRLGLKAIGIADHDTVAGIPSAIAAGEAAGVEIVPAIELSADGRQHEVHILGYFFRWQDIPFRKTLEKMARARYERARSMAVKLREMGLEIGFDDILKISGEGTIGRLHVAKALRDKGYIGDMQEAFKKYIGKGCAAYVEKYRISPADAIALIRSVGGMAVLAHPGLTRSDALIPGLKDAGLGGIEAYHIEHTPDMTKHYLSLAKRYGLAVSGGSDCHGHGKTSILLGKVHVPYTVLSDMRTYHASHA
ncbi:MAG TPA: PHP domain-containing protein [bacterium]|nr:PHP domain-containing protein [bacterium]